MRIIDNAFLEPFVGRTTWAIDKNSNEELLILKLVYRQTGKVTYMATNLDGRLIQVRFVSLWSLFKPQTDCTTNSGIITTTAVSHSTHGL